MTTAAELFQHFQTMWQAGTNACLRLECHAGEAWMNFQVHLHHPPPPPPIRPPPPFHSQEPPRKSPSPSRLRRRARRAKLCTAENAAVTSGVTDAAVQTDIAASASYNRHSDVHELHKHHHHQVAETLISTDVEG